MLYNVDPTTFPSYRQVLALRTRPVADIEIGKKISGKIERDAFIPGAIGLSGIGYSTEAAAETAAGARDDRDFDAKVRARAFANLSDDEIQDLIGEISYTDIEPNPLQTRDIAIGDLLEEYIRLELKREQSFPDDIEVAEEDRQDAIRNRMLNEGVFDSEQAIETAVQKRLRELAFASIGEHSFSEEELAAAAAELNRTENAAAAGPAGQAPAEQAQAPVFVNDENGEYTMRNGDYLVDIVGRGLHLFSRGDLIDIYGRTPLLVPEADGFATLHLGAKASLYHVRERMDARECPVAIRPVRDGSPVEFLEAGDVVLARENAPPLVVPAMDALGWRRNLIDEPVEGCGPRVDAPFEETVRELIGMIRDGKMPAFVAARARAHLEDLGRLYANRLRQTVENPGHFGNRDAFLSQLETATAGVAPTIDEETRNKKRAQNRFVPVGNFPTIDTLRRFLAEKGAPVGGMGKTVDSPVFSVLYRKGPGVAETFRSVFANYTKVALEDIHCVQANDNLVAWAKAGERKAPARNFEFAAMPTYRSSTDGVFEREGVEFMVVRDNFGGSYIYAWPSPLSLELDLEARAASTADAEKETVRIDVPGREGDDFMMRFMEEYALPAMAHAQARPPIARQVADKRELASLAYVFSAPYIAKEGLDVFAIGPENGDVEAIGLVAGANAQKAVIAKIGEAAKPEYFQALEAEMARRAAPAPEAGRGFGMAL
ncbi:MAG: hypothetical protein ING19_21715 [Azospirillum sp.]|nr:hypothetical protein [Azospirillum sp.]